MRACAHGAAADDRVQRAAGLGGRAGQQRGRHRPGVRREDGQGLRRHGPALGAGLCRRRLQRRHRRRRPGRERPRAPGPPDPPAAPPRPHRGPQPRLPRGTGRDHRVPPRRPRVRPRGRRAPAAGQARPGLRRGRRLAPGPPRRQAGGQQDRQRRLPAAVRPGGPRPQLDQGLPPGGHRRPGPALPVAPLHPGHGPPRGVPDRRGQGPLPAPRGRPVQVRARAAAGLGHRRGDPQVPADLPAQADHLLRRPRIGPDRRRPARLGVPGLAVPGQPHPAPAPHAGGRHRHPVRPADRARRLPRRAGGQRLRAGRAPGATAGPRPRSGPLSATEAPPSGSSASSPAPTTPDPGRPRRRAVTWVAVALASLAAFVALTWPLARHPDHFWTMTGNRDVAAEPNFVNRPGGMHGGDHLQNVFIQSEIVDNVRALRSPYLDLREGAAGPAPLKTTSLDVPWTALLAGAWPLVGLVPAYNLGLALASVATGLAAFAWLRRHTRWPLLAAAGALAYACSPNRMFQLTSHFNAVMWWAFPAALLAFEVMLERRRAGRRWGWPAAGLAAVTLTVATSGEFHLILYLTGLLGYLVVWTLVAALARRAQVPWGPLAAVAATVGAACAYVLVVFQAVFQGSVAGENGSWQQVVLYSPGSVWAMVRKTFGTQGEGLIYVGWPLLVLAALGLVAVLVRRRAVLTYGARAQIAGVRVYRLLFDHLPFLSLQRVPERLMVVTALVLVVLAVTALDVAGELLLAGRGRALVAAGLVLALATVALLADYRVSRNRLEPDRADNRVVAALRAAGDGAGPVLGVPILGQAVTWNSVSTYMGAQSRRRVLNAYNQTPAPWQADRVARLEPLNDGRATPGALEVLRETGTRQVVVVDEPRVFAPGEWQSTVDALVASGHFRLVVRDGPLALLELTG